MFNLQSKSLCKHFLAGGALLVAALGYVSCKPDYDLAEKQPSGFNSIYGYLEGRGDCKTFLQLIDELGEKEILSKTGSRTLFVARDDAFDAFFRKNKWNVRSYSGLSYAQKRLLLASAMIDNPYSTSMLSTAEGPVKGEVCRRPSSVSVLDSVRVIPRSQFASVLPMTKSFMNAINRDSMVLFSDYTGAAPMIHFNAKFVSGNKLENSDIDFLYGGNIKDRKPNDVFVNEARIVNGDNTQDVVCTNGFVHIVDRVITPLDNMSELIRTDSTLSLYSSLLERFAAVDYSESATRAYRGTAGHASVDSVFIKRYYSKRSVGSTYSEAAPFSEDKNGYPFDAALKFDPGWDTYVADAFNDREPLMEDMAVMIVPTNQALKTWWDGEGAPIRDYYGSLDNVPNPTIVELLNVNMLSSFTASLPSRFPDILDDANEPLGIKTENVDKVMLGCNGAVYVTNKVFAPKSYSSVLFPAVVDTSSFSVIKRAIDIYDYDKYLNSMEAKYIFLIPRNKDGMLTYVDPVSYGQSKSQMMQFYVDWTLTDQNGNAGLVCANVYECSYNSASKEWERGASIGTLKPAVGNGSDVIKNRLEEILDNIIVVGKLDPAKKYYKTKGNTFVRIEGDGNPGTKVYSSLGEELDDPLIVKKVHKMGNGHTFEVEGIVMGTTQSVAKTLASQPQFSEFLNVLSNAGVLAQSNSKDGWKAGDQGAGTGNLFTLLQPKSIGNETGTKTKAIYLLNAYHYTIYAPTNEAMKIAYKLGLPDDNAIAAAEALDAIDKVKPARVDSLKSVLLDFIKYHIQDNSIFVDYDTTQVVNGNYDSGKSQFLAQTDPETGDTIPGKYTPGRPYKIEVKIDMNSSSPSMTICDEVYRNNKTDFAEYNKNHKDQKHEWFAGSEIGKDNVKEIHIGKDVNGESAPFNLMAREYWYKSLTSSSVVNPTDMSLDNSSAVVIHAIDRPLFFDEKQFQFETKELGAGVKERNEEPRNQK